MFISIPVSKALAALELTELIFLINLSTSLAKKDLDALAEALAYPELRFHAADRTW